MVMASAPLKRIIPMAPVPEAVAIAAIVCSFIRTKLRLILFAQEAKTDTDISNEPGTATAMYNAFSILNPCFAKG